MRPRCPLFSRRDLLVGLCEGLTETGEDGVVLGVGGYSLCGLGPGCPLFCRRDLQVGLCEGLTKTGENGVVGGGGGESLCGLGPRCPLSCCRDLLVGLCEGLTEAGENGVVFLHEEQALSVQLAGLLTLLQLQPGQYKTPRQDQVLVIQA